MSTVIMQVLSQVAIPKPTNFHHKLFNISSKRCRFINTSVRTHGIRVCCSVKASDEIQTGRRSGGYQPALWNFDTIQSLNATNHHYNEGSNLKRAAALTAQVQKMLQQQEGEDDEVDRIRRLELVDDLRKLGISHHFDEEISNFLNYLDFKQRDLYSTALGFRLLRQNGVSVSQEVFDCFKNEEGSDFKLELCNDTKGLLQLYEASFVSTQGEETLEIAREFATKFLQKKLDHNEIDDKYLLSSVQEALAFPIHWKVQMPNAIPFIDAYKTKPHANPVVLELAQLDIDIVQAQFQEELKQASRWWNNTCLVQQLPFVRDRIVECYYWSTGVVERRQHGYERIMLTKIIALVTTIDDIYDVYGTLEELRLFTSDIRRWDTESMKQLPTYMQLCYLALYNFVNESAYDTLKEKGFNSIPYLHKTWVDLVESYMREAEWYYNGYKPSTDEYIDNAWISVGGIQILTHLFFRLTDFITMEIVETSMHKYHDLDRASCTILRLADDLGTSLDEVERGDVPKSVQCYMNEKNCSEEEAREHMRGLIAQMWKMMNKEMMTSADSPFSEYYVEVAANLARMAQCIYQQECDGFGMQHSLVNKMLTELLFDSYMSHNSVRA